MPRTRVDKYRKTDGTRVTRHTRGYRAGADRDEARLLRQEQTQDVLDTEAYRQAKREAKAERQDADSRTKRARDEARALKSRHATEEAERRLDLARRGLKRSFWTGKVVSA